jgi:hypothetical protein
MPKFTGSYTIDLEYTAKLQAGWFTDRFEMKPGHEQAVQDYITSHSKLLGKITMTLNREFLVVRTPDGEEKHAVKELIEDGEEPKLSVAAGEGKMSRFTMTYALRSLAPDVIQLQNRQYDLDGFAWRRAADA